MTKDQKIICYNPKCKFFEDHYCTKKVLSMFVDGKGRTVCGSNTQTQI
jgi:hypothetical protein